MMNDFDFEKFLTNIQWPQVNDGHHRARLKTKLLSYPRNERKKMNARKWKWAIAACCSLLALTAIGWAAEEVIRKTFLVQVVEQVELPDGSNQSIVTHESIVTFEGEVGTQEKAEQADCAVRQTLTGLWQALAQGKCELVEVKELDSGERRYIYNYVTEDGSVSEYSSNVPLTEPQAGWPWGE
jgi:hypothetical protein